MHIIPGSGGYKLAVFHHKHLIDRRQNLGNRTVRNVNKPFQLSKRARSTRPDGSVVQPSGELIHNVERAFVQEHTCKQDTLFLPAGKRPQIVAQPIVKTLRGNPLAQTCALTSPENLHIRHRRIVQANIFRADYRAADDCPARADPKEACISCSAISRRSRTCADSCTSIVPLSFGVIS